MKTIRMERNYDYRAAPRVFVKYLGGATYKRVPEAAVREIIRCGAGKIVEVAESE